MICDVTNQSFSWVQCAFIEKTNFLWSKTQFLSNNLPLVSCNIRKGKRKITLTFFSIPAPINLFSFLTINLHNLTLSLIARGSEDSLRSMAVLSGALLSGEAAKTCTKRALSLPSSAFITLRAQPKPPCYAGYSEERKTTARGLP